MSLRQHRRSAEIPPQRVLAEFVLQVGPPNHLAGEVDARQIAALEVREDVLTIGDTGRITTGRLLVLSRSFAAERNTPLFLARAIERQQGVLPVGAARQKDVL